jgi:hypothetical protein
MIVCIILLQRLPQNVCICRQSRFVVKTVTTHNLLCGMVSKGITAGNETFWVASSLMKIGLMDDLAIMEASFIAPNLGHKLHA